MGAYYHPPLQPRSRKYRAQELGAQTWARLFPHTTRLSKLLIKPGEDLTHYDAQGFRVAQTDCPGASLPGNGFFLGNLQPMKVPILLQLPQILLYKLLLAGLSYVSSGKGGLRLSVWYSVTTSNSSLKPSTFSDTWMPHHHITRYKMVFDIRGSVSARKKGSLHIPKGPPFNPLPAWIPVGRDNQALL